MLKKYFLALIFSLSGDTSCPAGAAHYSIRVPNQRKVLLERSAYTYTFTCSISSMPMSRSLQKTHLLLISTLKRFSMIFILQVLVVAYCMTVVIFGVKVIKFLVIVLLCRTDMEFFYVSVPCVHLAVVSRQVSSTNMQILPLGLSLHVKVCRILALTLAFCILHIYANRFSSPTLDLFKSSNHSSPPPPPSPFATHTLTCTCTPLCTCTTVLKVTWPSQM